MATNEKVVNLKKPESLTERLDRIALDYRHDIDHLKTDFENLSTDLEKLDLVNQLTESKTIEAAKAEMEYNLSIESTSTKPTEALVAWMSILRRMYAEGRLSADKIQELESLPGWKWTQDDL